MHIAHVGADYMTLRRNYVHDASTYLLGVLSELIHLKHGCTDRRHKDKRNHSNEVMGSGSFRQATIAISLCTLRKHASKQNTFKLYLKSRKMHRRTSAKDIVFSNKGTFSLDETLTDLWS